MSRCAVLLEQKAADPRKGVPRKVSQEMGGWGSTTQIEKEKRGDLRAFSTGWHDAFSCRPSMII